MKKFQKHTEGEPLSGNANATDKQASDSKQLVEYFEVENTPFTIVKQGTENGEEWYVTMGRYRLTQALKSREEADEAAKDESWFRIMQVAQIMIDDTMNELKKGEYKTLAEKGLEQKN